MGNSIDDFFDAADKVADKVVGALKNAHHPGKDYDKESIEDAELADEPAPKKLGEVIIGSVSASDGKGHYFHLFQGYSNKPFCTEVAIDPALIKSRKRPNPDARDFIACCFGCISKLIAFQTQSTPIALKELTDGL